MRADPRARPPAAFRAAVAVALLLAAAAAARAGDPPTLAPFLEHKLAASPRLPPLLARPGGRPLLVLPLPDRVAVHEPGEPAPAWEYLPPRPLKRILLSRDHESLLFLFDIGEAGALLTRTGKGAAPKEQITGARDAVALDDRFALLTGSGVLLFAPETGLVETLHETKSGLSLAALAGRDGSSFLAAVSADGALLFRAAGGPFERVAAAKGPFEAPAAAHLHFASERDAAAGTPALALAYPDRIRRFARSGEAWKELPAVDGIAGTHALVSWVPPGGGDGTLAALTPQALVALSADGGERWRAAGSFPSGALPAFVYRYDGPPLLLLAACPAGDRLALLDPATGEAASSAQLDGRVLPAPLLAQPAAADGSGPLLGVQRLDAIQFLRAGFVAEGARAESAALTPSLHETVPDPAGGGGGFSWRALLDPEWWRRVYHARPNAFHGAAGLAALAFALALRSRRRRRPRALSSDDLRAQVERLREMRERSPENVEILLNLSMLLEKLDDREGMIDCFRDIIRLRPAEEIYYERLLDLAPPHFPHVNELVAIYRKKGKTKAGVAAYAERLARIESSGGFDPAVAAILARFLVDEKSPDAVPLLRRLLDRDETLLEEQRLLADALEASGDAEGAMESLLRLAEADRTPAGLACAARFMRHAHALGMAAEAAEQFRIALESRKDSARELAPVMADLLDDALLAADRKAAPLYADCLADAHLKMRDPAGARKAVDRTIAKFPKEFALLRRRAFLRLTAGESADALPEFEALLREAPDDLRVKFECARLLAGTGREKECLALCADAVKKGQEPERFLDLYADHALARIREGRAEEAARGLAALYSQGKSQRLLPALAEAHLRLGDLDRSAEIYRGFLKGSPDDATAQGRLKYLATLLEERRLAELKSAEVGDFAGTITLLVDGVEVAVRRAAEKDRPERVSPAELKNAEAKLLMKKAEYRKAIPILQDLLKMLAGRRESLPMLLALVTCFLKERLAAAACKVFDAFDFDACGLTGKELHTVRYRAARLFEEYDELRQAEAVYAAVLAEDVAFADAADRLAAVRRSLTERERSVVAAPVDDGEKTVIQQTRSEADFIDRRYTVGTTLGKGGMGIVYRCLDTESGRQCAIKIPLVQFKDDRPLIERFEREAELMERLKHPNILEIFRVHRGELPYIVMEILDGRSLREILKERKSLPVPECRDLAVQICDALDYTHALKIVHRDIKPENVMVIAGGVAKVMDFGLAKAYEESSVTSVGTILGTYKYMAPEQCTGDQVDGRADLYALGVMFYEMLVGEPPFTSGDYIHQHLKVKPEPPTKRKAGIPYPVEAIVLKCLEKKPEHRYATAADLKNDWLKIL